VNKGCAGVLYACKDAHTGQRERERESEGNVEFVQNCHFYFKRNDGCLGTFYLSSTLNMNQLSSILSFLLSSFFGIAEVPKFSEAYKSVQPFVKLLLMLYLKFDRSDCEAKENCSSHSRRD